MFLNPEGSTINFQENSFLKCRHLTLLGYKHSLFKEKGEVISRRESWTYHLSDFYLCDNVCVGLEGLAMCLFSFLTFLTFILMADRSLWWALPESWYCLFAEGLSTDMAKVGRFPADKIRKCPSKLFIGASLTLGLLLVKLCRANFRINIL